MRREKGRGSPSFFRLQNQQQPQGHQQLLIRVLPEEEEQQPQQQQIPGVHMVQMELVQDMLEKAGQAVGGPAVCFFARPAEGRPSAGAP